MRINFYLACLSILFLFSSCEKKDKPITLPAKGDGTVMQLDMGENYEYQYYVSLQEQKIVHISRTDNWDLAFQSDDNQHGVFLNGGKGMAAYATSKTDFAQVNDSDTSEMEKRWKIDQACGLQDSSAIGNWKNKNEVYIIRLDKSGKKLRKIKITYEDAYQYIISVGDINTAIPASITILKNKDQNFTYFSFSFLTTVEDVEPQKDFWDIKATLYSYTFYDQNPPLPYVVNGFLLNPNNTQAYKDSLTGYINIKKDFATSVPLSSIQDVIGFDWKNYNIDNNIYTVVPTYSYIIKTRSNAYFKLRFLDFYSASGVKGSPKYEFQPL
jgi:hypothetical protein